jgi:hypothetical protein
MENYAFLKSKVLNHNEERRTWTLTSRKKNEESRLQSPEYSKGFQIQKEPIAKCYNYSSTDAKLENRPATK